RSERVLPHPSCSLHPLVGVAQDRQRIAAGKDEVADTGATPGSLLLAGPACQIDMPCAGCLKGLGGICGLAGIDLVRGTHARDRRAGRLEGRGELCEDKKSLVVDSLDAARLEKAFGKSSARGEIGGRAEIGEEDFWALPGFVQDRIRFV